MDHTLENAYHINLKDEYQFLKQKFNLRNDGVIPLQFFRLRPPNFPTIRLSQLAMLYQQHPNLFTKLISAKNISDFYDLFKVHASEFWNTHYTFEKSSGASPKYLTKSFIDLLLINTILPLQFCYQKKHGKISAETSIIMAQQIDSEKNGIIDAYNKLKPVSHSALHSQALIQLKTEYCEKNRCLSCAIGNSILSGKT